ncbi:MAG: molecular chaperone HtpG [Deltaproteobacteria bacterium]|nr:molecular chaperone HtpG [Deltaproteobacteria bacterium]
MAEATIHEFQTQAREILDLMVHSVYSHKDIFLRELISNASDALDRLRLRGLEEPALAEAAGTPEIVLASDAAARTLEVRDNGIGMNRDELVQFLGTIARSGTREFAEALRAARGGGASEGLIGQFGVGFYASFMVAKRVQVLTRRAGAAQGWLWDSTGDGTYSIREAARDAPGTTVTLFLRDADEEAGIADYTREWVLRGIVRKYSDFVSYPIRLGEATLNSMKAIWTRPEGEVTEEEYTEFYRHLTRDWGEPLSRIVSRAEGTSEFRMLLYLPGRAPADLYWRDAPHGVHLYIRRVFIMNDCEALLPFHLRFVKGVVDSEDLPLNISRELLQQDRNVRIIRRNLVKKVYDTLGTLRTTDRSRYETFWREFGRVLKEGLLQEPGDRETLLDLALFESSRGEGLTTLAEYLERMPAGQKEIYYLTGRSRQAQEGSPHLEAFRARGVEVLLLSDPVDELWPAEAGPHREKPFVHTAKGAVDLPPAPPPPAGEAAPPPPETPDAEAWKPLLETLRAALDAEVKEVRLSARLTSSPACLVGDSQDLTPQLEQMMRAMGQELPPVKRILEVNPAHPVVAGLRILHEADASDPRLAEYASLLHGQALLAEGGLPPDPAAFARRLALLLARSLEP